MRNWAEKSTAVMNPDWKSVVPILQIKTDFAKVQFDGENISIIIKISAKNPDLT